MKKFRFISLLLICAACSGHLYDDLQATTKPPLPLTHFAPDFATVLYQAQVDIVGHHLSGLLFFKHVSDKISRVVFTNEVGIKFFDFEFGEHGFKSIYCIEQLNKKVVINQLRQDIGFILLYNLDYSKGQSFHRQDEIYYYLPYAKNTRLYYITDLKQQYIKRIENTTSKKKKLIISLYDSKKGLADSIFLQHKFFDFTISLKQLTQ